MSIIGNRSKKVEQEKNAQANKETLSAKEIFENCRVNKTKPHAFSKAAACRKKGKRKLGHSSALLLRYLSRMLRKHGAEIDAKRWVRIKLDHIAAQYPYLSRPGVDKALLRLEEFGGCEIKNQNVALGRPSYDETRSFHIPKEWMDLAEQDLRYFYPALATVIGVPAAVIHHNFTHWMDELRAKNEEPVFSLAPADLLKLQSFSKSTIKRAITVLVEEGLIFRAPEKQCVYADLPMGSKVDEGGSKVDKPGSKVDKSGPKVDDDRFVSSFGASLEEYSKLHPADVNEPSSCPDDACVHEDISLEQTESLSPFATESGCSSIGSEQIESLSSFHTNDDIAFPVIKDFDTLHGINRQNQKLISSFATKPAIEARFIDKADTLTRSFFAYLGDEQADELYEDATDEELFTTLSPIYRFWFQQLTDDPDSAFFEIFYYGVFECVLGAFYKARHGHERSHAIIIFIRVAEWNYLDLFGRSEERRHQAIDEENAQLQAEFASPDADKECLQDISPAEKTRTFKQALYSRNKVGWVSLGGVRKTDQIDITSHGNKQVETLFALNPRATVGDLLVIVDRCMHLHATHLAVGPYQPGIKWHARMGRSISFLARYLKKVLRDLEFANPAFEHFSRQKIVPEENAENEELAAAA